MESFEDKTILCTKHMNTHWKNKEDKLSRIRDNMVSRGATAEEVVAETNEEQKKNNRLFDTRKKKYIPGSLV